MINTKNIDEFIAPLIPFTDGWLTVPIAGEENYVPADALANAVNKQAKNKAQACASLKDAIAKLQNITLSRPAVLFIAGSLYQAGHVLNYEQDLYDGECFVSAHDEMALLEQL